MHDDQPKTETLAAVASSDLLGRWVPITERLPDTRRVVMLSGDGEMAIALGKRITPGIAQMMNITHWLPIPELPNDRGQARRESPRT